MIARRWLCGQPALKQARSITAAASRAGDAHPVVYHEDFALSPLPNGHRFPMPKDHLLYCELQRRGWAAKTFRPVAPDVETLALVHDREYAQSFIDGSISDGQMRRIGLPWSQKLVRRTLIGTGSAVLAARLALQFGIACMCNGGTHHAHRAHGSGWCVFNDLAVAARAAQRDAGVRQVLFVDLDVHQGDGTAAIFAGDPTVYTFSVHCAAQSFPEPLHSSDTDVGLPAGTGDEAYMQALKETLPGLLARVRPDLVMYNAGVDVHADDALGKMALTDAGIASRDEFVLRSCAEAGVPVAAAIGGGYSPDHEAIVQRHVLLHSAARRLLSALQRNGRGVRARPS